MRSSLPRRGPLPCRRRREEEEEEGQQTASHGAAAMAIFSNGEVDVSMHTGHCETADVHERRESDPQGTVGAHGFLVSLSVSVSGLDA